MFSSEHLPAVVTAPSTRAREQRRETIRVLWLACHTQQEIADAVGIQLGGDLSATLKDIENLEALPKSQKLAALHEDADWVPPLYDIWNVSSNLRPDAASYLRGCLVRDANFSPGRPQKCGNNFRISDIAEETGVTDRTLRNDAAFADAVDTLADAVGADVPAGGMRRRPQERRRGTRWAVA